MSAKHGEFEYECTVHKYDNTDKIVTVDFEIIEKIQFFSQIKCTFHTKYTWGTQYPITRDYVEMTNHGFGVKHHSHSRWKYIFLFH